MATLTNLGDWPYRTTWTLPRATENSAKAISLRKQKVRRNVHVSFPMSRLEFFDVLNLPDYFFLLPEDFFEMKAQSEAGSQPRGRGVGME